MAMEVGSSGSLIAASLESIGYRYQSFILDTFSRPLTGPIATLVFVGSIGLAMALMLLTGKLTRDKAWLLIGPSMFLSVLLYRTPTTGSLWAFGKDPRNQAQVVGEVGQYFSETQAPAAAEIPLANVSSVFAWYNRFVSSIDQELMKVLTFAREGIDSRFIIRTELNASMRSEQIGDKRLRELIHGPFIRDCASMMQSAKDISPGPAEAPPIAAQIEQFTLAEKESIQIRKWPFATDFIRDIQQSSPDLYTMAMNNTPEQIGDQLASNSDLLAPSSAGNGDLSAEPPETLTCQQVWNFVFLGVYRYASAASQRYADLGTSLAGPNDEKLLKDLLQISTNKELDSGVRVARNRSNLLYLFSRVLANYLLRNEVRNKSASAFMNNYAGRGFEFPGLSAPGESDLSKLEEIRLRSTEWQEKNSLFSTAASLPYYQGLALYFLAFLFPFFAILLLIPGRYSGFFQWFFLWFWIKSWDIGFAVVMLLDDVLYSLFNPSNLTAGSLKDAGLSAQLGDVLWAFRTLDPTYQLTTYYSILGGVLAAVPVVSSYLVLGSLRGGAGLIAAGAQQLSTAIGAGGFIGRGQIYADMARRSQSQGEVDLSNRKMSSVWNGTPISLAPERRPNSPSIRNDYQSGNAFGTSGAQKFDELISAQERLGQTQAMTNGAGFNGSISKMLPSASPGTLQGFQRYASAMLARAETAGQYDKAMRSRRAEQLQTAISTDFAKRNASVPYESFINPEAQAATAVASVAGMLPVPLMNKDGDEEEMVKSDFANYQEARLLELEKYQVEADIRPPSPLESMSIDSIAKWQEYYRLKEILHEKEEKSPTSPDAFLTGPNNAQFPVGDRSKLTSLFDEIRPNQEGTGVRNHDGIDIASPAGTPVKPSQDGWIVFRGWIEGYGNTVIVQHGPDRRTLYGHFSSFEDSSPVTEPVRVTKDDVLGRVGATGNARGNHLHFEVIESHYQSSYYYRDPLKVITGDGEDHSRPVGNNMLGFFENLDKKFKNTAPFQSVPPSPIENPNAPKQ